MASSAVKRPPPSEMATSVMVKDGFGVRATVCEMASLDKPSLDDGGEARWCSKTLRCPNMATSV